MRVPYPGKYPLLTFDIENPKVNDTVVFVLDVENRGYENITNAWGEITIVDFENKTVVVLNTEGKFIESTKTDTLRATWFSDVPPGLYTARVKVFYDGEVKELEQKFNLGAPLIEIVNVTADPIVNGTIGKIITEVHSYWNQKIENVYVEFFAEDPDVEGRVIATDKSQNFEVNRFGTVKITNYWDTTNGVDIGEYRGRVILNYLEQNDTAEFDLEVVGKAGIGQSVVGRQIAGQ